MSINLLTQNHSFNKNFEIIALYAEVLAKYHGLDKEEIFLIKKAITQNHKEQLETFDTLQNKQFEFIASNIAYERHERYDGNGYPMGLKDEEISIHGRIVALANYIYTLGKNQLFWDNENIFEMIKNEKGKQFDPKLVDIFFDNLQEFFTIYKKL